MKTDVRMMGEIIILRTLKDNKTDTLFLVCDTTNSYNIIQKNDTLFKEPKNDSLFKIKDRQLVLINKIDFGCDTNKYKRKHHIDYYIFKPQRI